MKSVIVRYQVRAGFAEQNRANIQAVLAAHREAAHPGVRYAVFEEGDGRFVHLGMYTDEAAVDAATALPAFQRFQAELRASGPLEKPQATWMTPVGAGWPVFG